ncbi:MAG TPA: adenylate/guanylate cyclase domain-containing protein [Candidatus Limnocylindrales bacterium]|nr:adenylate/guanylate cyclase domain-containing protein [Candidatus Limnocylindrales bacterium]
MARPDLPSGTVTFLFSDVEGSTRLLHELGAEAYAAALMEHRRLMREAFARHGGVEVDTQGDAFFVAFPTAPGALAAAAEAQAALAAGPIRVRIGLHTGTPHLAEEGYVGPDVHRAARIAAAGHGGQVLLSSATAALVGQDGLTDLGEYRLKDLSAPERIFQLGDGAFPRLKTLYQTNLPVPASSFLGRERELAELGQLLARPEVRLLTLTGPGGTGKTRLALAAAGAAAEHYPDGVWWVPLAALRDPALVLPSVTQALGASGELAEHIGAKRLLLVLDNFEQLTPAAAELGGLLASCPGLELLVTSREPLHLAGEQEYAVDPLAPNEAVELFMTRALAAKRDLVADGEVAAICERLDHLPLAIELAAARVKILSPAALLERLGERLPLLAGGSRDLPERQRTLRATIEWSHELLTPEEQRLFARLSIFRGGCTLDAAEQVAGADLGTLGSLVDKSLLRAREDRFWMLETIREFAAQQLEATGDADELRARHADFFLALAEEAEPQLRRDELQALERLAADHDNLRAALDRLTGSRQTQAVLQMAGALTRFWYLRGHITEGRERLEAALAGDDAPTATRARALNGASVMAINAGDIEAARRFAEEARDLWRALGDPWGEAYAGMMIGNATNDAGDPAGAKTLFEQAVEAFDRLGDQHMALVARSNLIRVIGDLGDRQREEELLGESLALARRIGHERMEAGFLAEIAMGQALFFEAPGRFERARELMAEAIRIQHRRGNLYELAIDLGRMAFVHAHLGQAAAAARLLAGSGALLRSVGGRAEWTADRDRRTRERAMAELDEDAFRTASATGATMDPDELVAVALDPDA